MGEKYVLDKEKGNNGVQTKGLKKVYKTILRNGVPILLTGVAGIIIVFAIRFTLASIIKIIHNPAIGTRPIMVGSTDKVNEYSFIHTNDGQDYLCKEIDGDSNFTHSTIYYDVENNVIFYKDIYVVHPLEWDVNNILFEKQLEKQPYYYDPSTTEMDNAISETIEPYKKILTLNGNK